MATADSDITDWQAYFVQKASEARDPLLRRFYGAGMPAPDTPLSEVPMAALDLETTGLDASRNAIVSIGLIPFDLKRIRCRDAFYWVVKPSRTLEYESITFHHITHTDIEQAPDLTGVLGELLEVMAGRIMVAHYRQIERVFLGEAVDARLGEALEFPVIDTMALEARWNRAKKPGLWDRMLGRKPPSIRLAASRQRYGLPVYGAHHALTDAIATAELLMAQVATRLGPETPLHEVVY
ncbi:3'-5' exonuclease [Marinobacteraceae bacterium S3BR75-40.1]